MDEVYDQHVSSITDEVLINLLHRWLYLSTVYIIYYGTIKVSDFCPIFNLFQFSSPRDSKDLYWLFVGCSFETKINGAHKSCSGSGESFDILLFILNLLDCVSSDERAVLLGDGNITYLNKEIRILSLGTWRGNRHVWFAWSTVKLACNWTLNIHNFNLI